MSRRAHSILPKTILCAVCAYMSRRIKSVWLRGCSIGVLVIEGVRVQITKGQSGRGKHR